MQCDAITVDTNVFRNNGWNLEGGLLAQLAQFRGGSVQFVISEVVYGEICKYLKIEARKAGDAIEKGRRESRKAGLMTAEELEQLDKLVKLAKSVDEAAKTRLKTFADTTGMTVIPAMHADMGELIKHYFGPLAPFETSGKKKNEFPDAIALLSMEKWAEEEGKRILAISNDKGWSDFARDSTRIDVEKDLANALQTLQQHAEEVEGVVALLLSEMEKGGEPKLMQEFTDALYEAIEDEVVDAEAYSTYKIESKFATLDPQDSVFVESDDGYDFAVVQIGRKKVVVQIDVSVEAVAESEFSFSGWDPHSEGYAPWGDSMAYTDVEFDAVVLVTFEGDFSAETPQVESLALELIDSIDRVDFGEVGIG